MDSINTPEVDYCERSKLYSAFNGQELHYIYITGRPSFRKCLNVSTCI